MSDSLALIRCLIANVWNLLLGVDVPGIGISFAALFIAIFLTSAGIFLFKMVLGSDNGDLSSHLGNIFRHKDGD